MTRIVVVGGTGLIGAKTVARLSPRGGTRSPPRHPARSEHLTGEGLAARARGRGGRRRHDAACRPPPRASRCSRSSRARPRTSSRRGSPRVSAITWRSRSWERMPTCRCRTTPRSAHRRSSWARRGHPVLLVHATQFFEFVAGSARSRPSATRCGSRVCSCSPSRATTSRWRWRPPPRGRPSVTSRSEDLSSSGSTTSCAAASPPGATRGRCSATTPRPYFGGTVSETALVPGEGARLYATRFDDWPATSRGATGRMTVVLVEGESDRVALEVSPHGWAIPILDVRSVGGSKGSGARWRRSRGAGGGARGCRGAPRLRAGVDRVFVCDPDLEGEFVARAGRCGVEAVIAAAGELESFRRLQNQPAQRTRQPEAQLKRFFGGAAATRPAMPVCSRRRFRWIAFPGRSRRCWCAATS